VGRSELPTDALRGTHVLLVEDDQDSREIIATVLRYCGALVTAVASAEEALATMKRVRPDILLSDLSMPTRDGYWLIRQVRELPRGAGGDIPAIAVTAHGSVHGVERTLAAGFQAHLRKPLDPWELSRTVAELVGRPS
jgi:CheY-like chemotaxis protein